MTFVAIDRAAPAPSETTEADVPAKRKSAGRRPWTATVFHVSQTDPVK